MLLFQHLSNCNENISESAEENIVLDTFIAANLVSLKKYVFQDNVKFILTRFFNINYAKLIY